MIDLSKKEFVELENTSPEEIEKKFPKEEDRGPIFSKGQVLNITDVDFVIQSIGKNCMVLRILPPLKKDIE